MRIGMPNKVASFPKVTSFDAFVLVVMVCFLPEMLSRHATMQAALKTWAIPSQRLVAVRLPDQNHHREIRHEPSYRGVAYEMDRRPMSRPSVSETGKERNLSWNRP